MGWVRYSQVRGINLHYAPSSYILFEDDPLVRYFIDRSDIKTCYVVKELSEKEKQSSENAYKFVIADYNSKSPEFVVKEFNSNYELFGLIIENESCTGEYIRHFKINKLLKR